jgi:uncharacterized protein YndB with AHSA1/START domain
MIAVDAATRSIVIERLLPYPPEKIWRALTQSSLIEEWLMKNDFAPEVGHHFTFRATPLPGWSGVVNCEVVTIEAPHRLAYRWGDGTESDSGLVTLVTWTLHAREAGTLVRMEQSGFRDKDEHAHKRMGGGWPHVMERLEQVAGGVE